MGKTIYKYWYQFKASIR